MIKIEEYVLLPKPERQKHLRLGEPCIERGGGGKTGSLTSTYCRGLLAEKFDTTFPSGMKILVCHACHNGKCSNANHLYWGTPKENLEDARRNGTKSIRQIMIEKYGAETVYKMDCENLKKGRNSIKRKHRSRSLMVERQPYTLDKL